MSEASGRARLVVGLALAGLAVALFFATCERAEVEVPRGYVGAAARNHYLAAERLLDDMGMPARSFPDVGVLASLPPESSTLIVPTPRRALDERTSARLLDWVTRGGHLVVVTWQLWDDPKREPDPILDPVGVRQFLNGDSGGSGGGNEPEAEPPEPNQPALADSEFPDRDEPLELRFDPRFRIELDAEAGEKLVVEAGDEAGTHLVTIEHGKGLITALTDDTFMTQPEIGELDHAEMVYRLSRLGGHRGPVWFVYGDEFPSAWRLLLRHGWMVAASGLALLALWLWSASRRYGPIAPDPPAERRELMEHVRAAGRLQWRHGGGAALVSAARAALFARMRERHPAFHEQTPSEQAAQLEALSGVPRERIAEALEYPRDLDPAGFAAKIAILEKLRRSL